MPPFAPACFGKLLSTFCCGCPMLITAIWDHLDGACGMQWSACKGESPLSGNCGQLSFTWSITSNVYLTLKRSVDDDIKDTELEDILVFMKIIQTFKNCFLWLIYLFLGVMVVKIWTSKSVVERCVIGPWPYAPNVRFFSFFFCFFFFYFFISHQRCRRSLYRYRIVWYVEVGDRSSGSCVWQTVVVAGHHRGLQWAIQGAAVPRRGEERCGTWGLCLVMATWWPALCWQETHRQSGRAVLCCVE